MFIQMCSKSDILQASELQPCQKLTITMDVEVLMVITWCVTDFFLSVREHYWALLVWQAVRQAWLMLHLNGLRETCIIVDMVIFFSRFRFLGGSLQCQCLVSVYWHLVFAALRFFFFFSKLMSCGFCLLISGERKRRLVMEWFIIINLLMY